MRGPERTERGRRVAIAPLGMRHLRRCLGRRYHRPHVRKRPSPDPPDPRPLGHGTNSRCLPQPHGRAVPPPVRHWPWLAPRHPHAHDRRDAHVDGHARPTRARPAPRNRRTAPHTRPVARAARGSLPSVLRRSPPTPARGDGHASLARRQHASLHPRRRRHARRDARDAPPRPVPQHAPPARPLAAPAQQRQRVDVAGREATVTHASCDPLPAESPTATPACYIAHRSGSSEVMQQTLDYSSQPRPISNWPIGWYIAALVWAFVTLHLIGHMQESYRADSVARLRTQVP